MPFCDFEVRSAVPRSDSHDTGTERHVDRIVFDDGRGDRAVYPFGLERLSVFPLRITWIVRVHDDILVAELCFRTRCADGKRAVFEVIERRLFFLVDNLVIRNRCLTLRIPVDDAMAAIDESGIVHLLEDRAYGATARLIKCERFARPVERSTHRLQLS